ALAADISARAARGLRNLQAQFVFHEYLRAAQQQVCNERPQGLFHACVIVACEDADAGESEWHACPNEQLVGVSIHLLSDNFNAALPMSSLEKSLGSPIIRRDSA